MTLRLTIIMLVLVFFAGARCSAGVGFATIGVDESPLTNLDLSALPALSLPDCFAVTNELKVAIPSLRPDVQQAWPPPASPTADTERQAWQSRLRVEDLPPGAQVYVARLKPIFVHEGVPAELVWLAEVESEFDTLARSSIGAVGLFQLMPDTAAGLGLALTPSDQRLQPEKNARAAARYLKLLYGMFHDWRLAVAAYNGGEGLVGRLLEKRGAHSYDEIASGLPSETQMYVPKVEATIMRREGVGLQDLKGK